MNVIHLPQEQKEKQKAVVLVEEEKKSEYYIDKNKVFEDWEKTEYESKEYYEIQNLFIKKSGFIFQFPIIVFIWILLFTEIFISDHTYGFWYYGYVMGFYVTYKFITEYFFFRKEQKQKK